LSFGVDDRRRMNHGVKSEATAPLAKSKVQE
jgi:hypothetical protein